MFPSVSNTDISATHKPTRAHISFSLCLGSLKTVHVCAVRPQRVHGLAASLNSLVPNYPVALTLG